MRSTTRKTMLNLLAAAIMAGVVVSAVAIGYAVISAFARVVLEIQ